MDKVSFTLDNGETAEFYVLEQTKINGMQYILVTDTQEDNGEALIMKRILSEDKDMSQEMTFNQNEDEYRYEIVDNDTELNAIAAVFANLLDDVEFAEGE